MKIIKPQTLGLLTRPFEFRRQFWLGVSVLAFLPISETPALLKETEMWALAAGELPDDQPLDAAIPKRQAEFLAAARACAPGGEAVEALQCGIQIGAITKTLNVYGDRRYSGNKVSQVSPFTQMPIDWAHAYGGPALPENPKGKGMVPLDGPRGSVFEAPNIRDPALGPAALRTPAGYWPVDQMAPSRLQYAGTHDKAWLNNDFPGFARDIDWRFFNMAPPSQFLPPLTGAESYAFKNLHPEKPLLQGTLPGMAPRAFLVRKSSPDGFEEIPLALTTIWCFPHRERLILIHHGHARLAEEDGSDIARMVIGADAPGERRPAEAFRTVMVQRADTRDGGIYVLQDSQLVPEAWILPDDEAETDGEETPIAAVMARQRRAAEAAYAENVAKMVAKGVDPAKIPPMPPPAPHKKPSLAELPAIAAAARKDAEAKKAEAEAVAATKRAEAAARMENAGVPKAEIDAKLNAKPKGPPTFSAAATKANITKQLEKVPETQKASLDLTGQFAALDTAEKYARDGYKLGAHTQDKADPAAPERADAIRRLVLGDSAAARALYDLHGADLSGLDLSRIDLSGVCLDGANLENTNLRGAKLANAVLAHANLKGCVLDGADLNGASLGKADLTEASLKRAVMKKVVLAGADLTDADCTGADLEKADLSDAILTRTNFSTARAPEMLAMKLDLSGVNAAGMMLDKAKFMESDLSGIDLSASSLERAVFLDCKLVDANLSAARLYKAVFVKDCDLSFADFSDADLREANLREVKLAGAVLAGADMRKADFSGANMARAVLPNVRADDCRFVAADMQGADLRHGSFASADLARADLRGADLTNISVYEANMPRVKLDEKTRRGGMLQTRLRYLPVYQPPEDVA